MHEFDQLKKKKESKAFDRDQRVDPSQRPFRRPNLAGYCIGLAVITLGDQRHPFELDVHVQSKK